MGKGQDKWQWLYGIHSVEALLHRAPKRIQRLCIASERADQRVQALQSMAERLAVPVEQLSRLELEGLVEGNHQGVLAWCDPAPVLADAELRLRLQEDAGQSLWLVLDGVTDPHNLGACLRSAEAAGAAGVIIPKDRAVGLTATVRKVSCGASEILPVYRVTNLARAMRQLQDHGVWSTGLCGHAETSVYDLDFRGPTALVLGAEGKGLRQLTRRECDTLAKLPMPGTMESLNVSVAAGICLFEVNRQRLADGP